MASYATITSGMSKPSGYFYDTKLGMNVLREFLITIDSIDRTITLKHRPYPKRYHLENYSVSMLADATDENSQKCCVVEH